MKNTIIRFGVSLDSELLTKFDVFIKNEQYSCRSEAIRDLIRNKLVQDDWSKDKIVAGAITITFDHHKRILVNKLLEIQHDFQEVIMASQHIHIDHDNCLEIIAVKGSAKSVKKLADRLKSIKGVKHESLSMTTTGERLT